MDSLESEPSIPLVQKPDMTLTLQAQQNLISNFLCLTTEFCFFKIQREKKEQEEVGGQQASLEGQQQFQQLEGSPGLFPSIVGRQQPFLSTYYRPWDHKGEKAKKTGGWNLECEARPRGCHPAQRHREPADLPKAGDSSFILRPGSRHST